MVSSGSVMWTTRGFRAEREDLVFPPRQLSSTAAKHIGTALLDNFETCFFGCSVKDFFAKMSAEYQCLSFITVGDAASANVKCMSELFAFLSKTGREHDVSVIAIYTPCFMHQLVRVILLHLAHQKLTASLYSISRITQHTTARKRMLSTMKRLLMERFDFHADSTPPICTATSRSFRKHLQSLLLGTSDDALEAAAVHDSQILKCLEFFNGDILDGSTWSHFCKGCHRSRQHALNDAAEMH
ncbi:unnamed protein product [Effrenium voratum]|nr:unnamed protein product [Effrenium voratum]